METMVASYVELIGKAPLLELRHLRCFVAIAEMRHFGQAAERIGIAQPALSQQMARLEAMVGHPLVTRGRTGAERVALTEAGGALLPLARELLMNARDALHTARAAARGEKGVLRIAFVASLAGSSIPSAIQQFRAAYPDVSLRLREMTTAPMLDALRAGALDVGLGREVTSLSGVQAATLFTETLRLVTPSAQFLEDTQAVDLASAAGAPFILPPREAGPSFHERLVSACLNAGFAPNIAQEVTEWSTILALVAAGMGVSLAPAAALSTPPTGVKVHSLKATETTSVELCWRADHASAARGVFISHLRAAYPQSRTE